VHSNKYFSITDIYVDSFCDCPGYSYSFDEIVYLNVYVPYMLALSFLLKIYLEFN